MTPQEMRDRTDKFSVDVINFCKSLPADQFTRRIALQLHDAGTSVASNYHAACRAQSRAAFTAKISISLEEADECVGWLHKLAAAKLANGPELERLRREAWEFNGQSSMNPQSSIRNHHCGVFTSKAPRRVVSTIRLAALRGSPST